MPSAFARRASIVLAFVSLPCALARAHERDFTLSRDWHLPYAGEHEIESRTFYKSKDFTQQLEYEYGVTDHFAIEPGLNFKKDDGEDAKIEAAEMELRFNFLDFGFNRFLPAVNVEYERHIKTDEEEGDEEEDEADNDLEFKGILSFYTERQEDFTLNLNAGHPFGGSGDYKWESELTLGYMRNLDFIPGIEPSAEHPLRCGIEFFQELTEEHLAGLGPIVGWRASKHFHLLAAQIFALNKPEENANEFRLILEWEF